MAERNNPAHGDVIRQLHEIAGLCKGVQPYASTDVAQIREAIQKTRSLIVGEPLVGAGRAQGPPLQQLNQELATWETKLDVILREPVGRQGMAKHALHWAEKLTSLRGA